LFQDEENLQKSPPHLPVQDETGKISYIKNSKCGENKVTSLPSKQSKRKPQKRRMTK